MKLTVSALILRLLVMAVVTYLVRMLPFLLVRKKLNSPFLRSFLYYLPYSVLAAMILPDIFFATASVWSAVAGLAVAVLFALWGKKLMSVAVSACVAVYATEFLLRFLETGTITF